MGLRNILVSRSMLKSVKLPKIQCLGKERRFHSPKFELNVNVTLWGTKPKKL